MKKPNPHAGLSIAAKLIQLGIDQLSKSPSLRSQSGISLVDLEQARKVRRKLLKQIPK